MGIIHPASLAEVMAYALPVVGLLRRNGGISRRPPIRPPTAPAAPAASGGSPPPTTPLTIISSVSVLQWVRADLGITIGTGVSGWADQSGNHADYAQATGANQPAYAASDATLNNLPTLTFDGSNDLLDSTIALAANTWIRLILKQITWTNTHRICGGNSAGAVRYLIRQDTSSPNIQQVATAAGPDNGGLAVGSWGRVEAHFNGTAADYIKAITTTVTGTTSAAPAATSFQLGAGLSLLPANVAIFEALICSNKPSAGEISALDTYTTNLCGAGLV